jgi:hypothetical protein
MLFPHETTRTHAGRCTVKLLFNSYLYQPSNMPKKDVRQAAERERKLAKVAAEVSWIDSVLASGPLEDVLENKRDVPLSPQKD